MAALIMAVAAGLSHPTLDAFQKDLKIEIVEDRVPSTVEKTCTLFLVYCGTTDWLDKNTRIQGWEPVPLNDAGREQMRLAAQKFLGPTPPDISAIYTSSLPSAQESAEILQKELHHSMAPVSCDELRGECHGEYDGYTREQYSHQPHFQYYKSLSIADQIFCCCGEGIKNGNRAESKADMAKRAIPKLLEIASHHLGEKVIVVTHRGPFSIFNVCLGLDTEDHKTDVPNGSVMEIEATGDALYLSKSSSIY